jgi:hypothetical protein
MCLVENYIEMNGYPIFPSQGFCFFGVEKDISIFPHLINHLFPKDMIIR